MWIDKEHDSVTVFKAVQCNKSLKNVTALRNSAEKNGVKSALFQNYNNACVSVALSSG